jgi:FdhE protein
LVQFCADLAAGGAGDAATNLASAIGTGRVDAGSLLTACLVRDQETVRSGAIHLGLAPDLAWLVAELATGPVVHSLQRTVFSTEPGPLADALGRWDQGYCPACGSWPALAEVVDQHRLLRCAFCAAAWERTQYACVYCNEAGEAFATVVPDPQRPDRRIEACRSCGAYLKATDSAEASPFPLIAIADMESMDLDVAAMDHHYGRPPLREFRAGRNSTGLRAQGQD